MRPRPSESQHLRPRSQFVADPRDPLITLSGARTGMFKIFIGNLDKRTTVEQVKMLLASFPDLEDLVLATDDDGKSRGFAIAMFRDPERGKEAIAALSQRRINGRELVVNEALSKKDRKKFLAEKAKQDAERQRGFGPRGPGGMSSRPSNRPFNRNPRRSGGFGDDRRSFNDGGSSGPSYGSPRQFGGHGGGHGGSGGFGGSRSGAPSGPPGTGRIGGVGLGGSRPMSGGPGPGAPRPPMGMPPARPPTGAPSARPPVAGQPPMSTAPSASGASSPAPAPTPRPLTFGSGRPTTPPSAIPLAAPRSPLAPRSVPPVPARPASPAPASQAPVTGAGASAGSPPPAIPASDARVAPPVAERAPVAANPAPAASAPATPAERVATNPPAKAPRSAKAAAPKSSEKLPAKGGDKASGKSASKSAAKKVTDAEPKAKAKSSKPVAAKRKKPADEE